MELTRAIIANQIERHEWLSELNTLLAEIENNIESAPDITIESCKSIVEAIAKTLLSKLDVTYLGEKDPRNDSLNKLIGHLHKSLYEKVPTSEAEYLRRICGVFHHIGEIRNTRAEISHGKVLPKELRSTIAFAKSIKTITDGYVYYLFELYFSIDFSYRELLKYEENPDFNDYLDDLYPLEGYILYSKALFEQDFDSYNQQLQDFKDEEFEIE